MPSLETPKFEKKRFSEAENINAWTFEREETFCQSIPLVDFHTPLEPLPINIPFPKATLKIPGLCGVLNQVSPEFVE